MHKLLETIICFHRVKHSIAFTECIYRKPSTNGLISEYAQILSIAALEAMIIYDHFKIYLTKKMIGLYHSSKLLICICLEHDMERTINFKYGK